MDQGQVAVSAFDRRFQGRMKILIDPLRTGIRYSSLTVRYGGWYLQEHVRSIADSKEGY